MTSHRACQPESSLSVAQFLGGAALLGCASLLVVRWRRRRSAPLF